MAPPTYPAADAVAAAVHDLQVVAA